jgi:Protein of unknown function (DUF3105)
MRLPLALALLLASGCWDENTPLSVPDLSGPDLAAPTDGPRAGDLPLPIDGGGGDAHDLGMPDLGPPDQAAPTDGSDGDGADLLPPPCKGGYLNGGGCPLGCDPAVEPVADEGAFHVPYCESVQYVHNPPASGFHWPWHSEWGIADQVIQREYWVHNLEHGGIILLYNCPPPPNNYTPSYDGGANPVPFECDGGVPPPPNNCAKDITALQNLLKAQKPDKFGVVRIVLTPDPKLPRKFGAVAWDWSYLADAVDTKVLQCFIDARYGFGPEDAP